MSRKPTLKDLKRVNDDKKNEQWDQKSGKFKDFWDKHIGSLGAGNTSEKTSKSGNINASQSQTAINRIVGSGIAISNNIQILNQKNVQRTNSSNSVKPKPKPIKPKPKPKPPPPKKPTPKPKPVPVVPPTVPVGPSPEIPEEPVPEIQPPPVPVIESLPIPPVIKKEEWTSRVGYFVSASDLFYYPEEPVIYDTSKIEIDFEEYPEGYLRLKGGQTWTSDWYDAGVIRGMDINTHGTHRLNYVNNPGFEL